MGNRRIGRKRLYGVEKAGQKIDLESGAGISGAIVSATQHRQGQEIITEIAIDLDGLVRANGDGKACGLTGKAAQITQLTQAKYGVITEIRSICMEVPKISTTTREVNVCLGEAAQNTNAGANTGEAITGATDSNPTALSVVGQDEVQDIDNAATFQTAGSEEYLYISSDDGNTGNFSQGKILIYLHGFVVPDDAS